MADGKAVVSCLVLVVAFLLPELHGETEPDDVLAVEALYLTLKAPPLSGWRSNTRDPCGEHWQGIECSGGSVTAIHLSDLGLNGSLDSSLSQFKNLLTLNLSRNALSGQIPDIFHKFLKLQILDLSNNKLIGKLPFSFGDLKSLVSLDLHENDLNGSIEVLAQLHLQYLNIENNRFSGPVPPEVASTPIFRSKGNQINMVISPTPAFSTSISHKKWTMHTRMKETLGIVLASFFLICLLCIVICFKRNHHHKETMVAVNDDARLSHVESLCIQGSSGEKLDIKSPLPYHSPYLSPNASPSKVSGKITKDSHLELAVTKEYSFLEIQAATNDFAQENLLGEGVIGRVYKANFPDGTVLAIKKLDIMSFAASIEDILRMISNISRIRQADIIRLVGFSLKHNHCLLLYEYFGKGTLRDILHTKEESQDFLTWNTRVKIALGVAKALAYLHETCIPPMVHKNLKSSNILLDESLAPHLSDCGLATLTRSGCASQMSSQMLRSFGYSAPEYALSGIYTEKSDVYSFGIVMLELLTGREALDRKIDEPLARWAVPQLQSFDSLIAILDPNLKGIYPARAVSRFAEIICKCVQTEARLRPKMSEVMQLLVRIIQRTSLTKRNSSRAMQEQEDMENFLSRYFNRSDRL